MSINLALALSLLNSSSVRAARVLLALFALELGAQPLVIGILAATFSAFPALLSVQAGRLADRFGSRWLLTFGAIGGGLGMLVPYFERGLVPILVAAAMIGLSSGIYNVSLQNLVGLLSTPDNRARNFSNYSMMESISNFIGPLLAGFSIDHSDHATACLYLALLTLLPISILAIRGSHFGGGVRHVSRARSGGIRELLSEPGVRRMLATNSLLNTGKDLYQFYMPVYTHSIGFSPSIIGIVLAVNSAAAFVVRLVLPRLLTKLTEEQLLAYAFYVGAVSLILIPLFQNFPMLSLLSFIFGLSIGVGGPIVTMLMFTSSAEGRSGEALGLRMTVNHLTKILGPVMFGFLGSLFGLVSMFWLNALLLGTGGMLCRTDAKSKKER